MENEKLTKRQFIRQAVEFFGRERVKRQLHTLRECDCDTPGCAGWVIDPGPEPYGDRMFVMMPGRLEL